MLGVNLVFAGFALTLNGVSYFTKVDDNVKAFCNILVGIVIAINAIFQTATAVDHVTFGFAAAMWLFSLNYFVIAAHIFFKAESWKAFGLYGLFAAIVSFHFMLDTILTLGDGAPWEMVYLWGMWFLLWLQTFLSIMVCARIDKLSPYILIINGTASTFVPGLLILSGIIL